MSSFEPQGFVPHEDRFVADPLPSSRPPEETARTPEPPPPPDPEELTRRAYEEGYAAGQQALPWREAEALESAGRALAGAARELEELRRTYLLEHRRAILELATAIAERLVAHELRVNEAALQAWIERALARAAGEGPLELRVAPRDLETVERGLGARIGALPGALRLHADAELSPGDARVAAGPSEVDARVREVIARLREALEESLGAPEPESET